jgi:transcriptional regulator with XRE-family HTH domain
MNSKGKEHFAANLNRLMSDQGISQMDLARRLNRTQSTVSDWCNGRTYPRIDVMQQVADVFGVLLTELVKGPGEEIKATYTLNEKEIALLRLFNQVPEQFQPSVVEMIRAAIGTKK